MTSEGLVFSSSRLERERTDRKVRGSNPASASRLPLSRLGQPGSIPALVLPSGGMAARHRKGATAERFFLLMQTKGACICKQQNTDSEFVQQCLDRETLRVEQLTIQLVVDQYSTFAMAERLCADSYQI
ncbi:hypothetical protein CSKR_101705 [Clonorchis sinensis]|uniref:Uncharacterized protein n=1 Tax=Clonorchis sinensis TaxID=79923 RepID=A0A3R7C850_CLOSI|nr:hypothetical protein CSKR_101705 [Clonorchis sinensis]